MFNFKCIIEKYVQRSGRKPNIITQLKSLKNFSYYQQLGKKIKQILHNQLKLHNQFETKRIPPNNNKFYDLQFI